MSPHFIELLKDVLAPGPGFSRDGMPVFVPSGMDVTVADLTSANQRLGVALPESYQFFLLRCGPGDWCGETIPHPDALYAFGPICWEAAGFVGLVHDLGTGEDYVAFDPADPECEGERPVYYCSLDPFGYAKVADSFEDWARRRVEEGAELYRAVRPAVFAKWEQYKARLVTAWFQCWH